MKTKILLATAYLLLSFNLFSQETTNETANDSSRNIVEYNLILEKHELEVAGKTSKVMTINGGVPGPTLEFTEGDLAVIHVTNKMKVESSIHWHGLILPNYQDGVPYLTTPPILPDSTFTYRIPINHSGTFWYHSHTMLQEQKGVFGSIVIHPKVEELQYDKELVIVFSDWTHDKPEHVLHNLKRGNEWYQVKKGTAVPLSRVIARGAVGAQLKMWKGRMEGADIADVYYNAFLSNGEELYENTEFKPNEKVRIRMINAAASTYFWVDFGGGNPTIVSSDGIDVQPVEKSRFLFPIAETYDVIVTIPNGQLEITATAQDGSGHTSVRLGTGHLIPAEVISRPDKVNMMEEMMKMDMRMGAPTIVTNRRKKTPEYFDEHFGMQMDSGMNHNHDMEMGDQNEMDEMSMHDHSTMNHDSMQMNQMHSFEYTDRKKYFNYDFLKAKEPTSYDSTLPVQDVLLNLTGNMNRYTWSLNGTPLSEADKISINAGEVTRITYNNLTMMHHPMHLHGHYFRVVNENGEYSPLKHTVNVAPMQKVVIEVYNTEEHDWFLHCHILYHMMSGMARIYSYDTPRDERMSAYPVQTIINETNHWFGWGTIEASSNYTEAMFTTSNIRNEFNATVEMNYTENLEAEVGYAYYLNDWFRVYAAGNIENSEENSLNAMNPVGLIGIKYFTPYMFYVDLSLDHLMRPRFMISRELMLFPRFFLEAEYEVRSDFGAITVLNTGEMHRTEQTWAVIGEFMVSKNFSLQGNYHSDYKWGGGIVFRL